MRNHHWWFSLLYRLYICAFQDGHTTVKIGFTSLKVNRSAADLTLHSQSTLIIEQVSPGTQNTADQFYRHLSSARSPATNANVYEIDLMGSV
jgi:hypothetical protein